MSSPLPSPPHSCIILLPISQFGRFSASLLKSDDSQLYPMHMKHNGTSITLLRLIDGVYPIFGLNTHKLLQRLTQSGRYSAPKPPTTAAPPQSHRVMAPQLPWYFDASHTPCDGLVGHYSIQWLSIIVQTKDEIRSQDVANKTSPCEKSFSTSKIFENCRVASVMP